MLLRNILIAALLSAGSSIAVAQNADINLGNKSASFRYNAFVGGSNLGRTELNLGLLYNEEGNIYSDVGFLVVDTAGSKAPGLEVGVGPKLMFLWHDTPDAKGFAISLGGRLNYKPQKLNRLRLGIEGYFAPNITTFVDANTAYQVEARIGYEVLPTAVAYLGYRRVRASFNKDLGSHDMDKSPFLGIQFSF